MQMLKQLWKKTRNVRPCRLCGGDHKTGQCRIYTKNGKKRSK